MASTRVQDWGDEPCEPTVRLPDWSELVASYSRMKSVWGWANGGQPILVCYIRKYVIILGGYSRWRPPTKILGMCPRHPRRGPVETRSRCQCCVLGFVNELLQPYGPSLIADAKTSFTLHQLKLPNFSVNSPIEYTCSQLCDLVRCSVCNQSVWSRSVSVRPLCDVTLDFDQSTPWCLVQFRMWTMLNADTVNVSFRD